MRCGLGWVGLVEGGEAFAEAGCVLVGDGEDADAALGAAGAADEVVATAAVGVGYGGVYDLDEGGSWSSHVWSTDADELGGGGGYAQPV